MYFPTTHGQSLDGRSLTIPFTLEGEFNILLVLFNPTHQFAVQTWLKYLKLMRQKYARVRFYEVPTLQTMSLEDQAAQDDTLRTSFVLEDQLSLETVITLYVDKPLFREHLGILDEDELYLFLIDSSGVILWRCEGTASVLKADELGKMLDSVATPDLPDWLQH
jgi:hypothetical protein